MRSKFKPEIEKYRVEHPTLGMGDARNGLFVFVSDDKTEQLRCIVSDGFGWDHVSVSVSPTRLPRWDEMESIKKMFFHPNEWVVQYHPAEKDYVDLGIGVLHLWRPQKGSIPKPPKVMV